MFWNGRTAIDGLSGSGTAAPLRRAETHAKHLNPGCDVLQRRRAEVIDLKRHLAGGILAHTAGDADATWLGQRLQACCDDHTVA